MDFLRKKNCLNSVNVVSKRTLITVKAIKLKIYGIIKFINFNIACLKLVFKSIAAILKFCKNQIEKNFSLQKLVLLKFQKIQNYFLSNNVLF